MADSGDFWADAALVGEPVQPFSGRTTRGSSGTFHHGIVDALNYAHSISGDVTAVYIELEPGSGEQILEKWEVWWPQVPLVILPSPYRSIVGPLLDYLDKTDEEHDDGQLAMVVLPGFVPARWWQGFLHSPTAWLLKAALLYRRRNLGYQRAIVDVPYRPAQ